MTEQTFADRFALSDGIYLLNHSVGRMPKAALEGAQAHFFDAWSNSSTEPWQEWLGCIDKFKQELAALFNGQPNDFCPQSNLTSGLVKVLGALQREKKNATLLASENDFPSMGFAISQAEQLGINLKWLPKDHCLTELEAWEQALDGDVDIVFISHVHYNTNSRVPVEGICKMAAERSIFSMVDIAQSAGIVPIDFTVWSADVVLGSCVKWLCGGPGAGFLWTGSTRARELEPIDVGWFSHENPFEFKIHNFEYANSANRFWGGTPSVVPYAIAASSIAELRKIGVKAIYEHNRTLTQVIIDTINSDELVTPVRSENRGGTLVIRPLNRERAEKNLRSAHVQFDSRALGLRLSPHIYNSVAEMETVASCLV